MANRICTECNALLRQPGEYHPYEFCVLYKAGLDPWEAVQRINKHLGLVPPDAMPTRPPLTRDLAYPRYLEKAHA